MLLKGTIHNSETTTTQSSRTILETQAGLETHTESRPTSRFFIIVDWIPQESSHFQLVLTFQLYEVTRG